MTRGIYILLLSFIVLQLHSQTSKLEFEGIIEFKHIVIPHMENYDTNYDYNAIGKSSKYYYKDGNIIFETENSYFRKDIFLSKENVNYFITNNPDTILLLDATKSDAELIDYEVALNTDTILNYSCNKLTIKLKPIGKEEPISYRRYYFTDNFYVNPVHFEGSENNFYELIYSTIKSVPLRIEYTWPNKTVRWEATSVREEKIDDEDFKIDKNKYIQKLN